MTAKRPAPIRVGDRVRVVVPQAVKRVGYPKEARDYLAGVVAEREAEARKLFGYGPRIPPIGAPARAVKVEDLVAKMPPPLRRALWDLAYLACKRDGFGGRERRVHLTEPLRGWEGIEFEVRAVRSVMEGDYFAPDYSCDHWAGECDNEPGGLDNQRVRRLVAMGHTLLVQPGASIQNVVDLSGRRIEFPVEHLEVVERAPKRGASR